MERVPNARETKQMLYCSKKEEVLNLTASEEVPGKRNPFEESYLPTQSSTYLSVVL